MMGCSQPTIGCRARFGGLSTTHPTHYGNAGPKKAVACRAGIICKVVNRARAANAGLGMGKTKREMLYAAGVGLVVGIAVIVYAVNINRPSSGIERAILLTLLHELWIIDKLFDVNWSKETFSAVHVVYSIFLSVVVMGGYRYFRPLPPANPNACLACHYDLTGNESGTCPECGTAIEPLSATEVAG